MSTGVVPRTEDNWYGSDDALAALVGNVECQPGCRFDGYDIDGQHYECIAAALRAHPEVVLAALGMTAVAMSDSDCGWVVSASVEAAGAWSTVPDGGWTRADT